MTAITTAASQRGHSMDCIAASWMTLSMQSVKLMLLLIGKQTWCALLTNLWREHVALGKTRTATAPTMENTCTRWVATNPWKQSNNFFNSQYVCPLFLFQIECCDAFTLADFEPIVQGNPDTCMWLYGDYGVTVDCPVNQAIFGRCGSGQHHDCVDVQNNGPNQCHGILCCEVEILEQKWSCLIIQFDPSVKTPKKNPQKQGSFILFKVSFLFPLILWTYEVACF